MTARRLLCLGLLIGFSAGVAFGDNRAVNEQIARYFTQAAQSDIDREAALQFIDDALEFNPRSSDALLLRAHLNRRDQQLTGAVIDDLETALEANEFSVLSRTQAVVTLAEVLTRVGRWREAVTVLDTDDLQRPDTVPELRARASELRIRAYRALGEPAMARQALARARRSFPMDPGFLYLELLEEPIPDFSYRRDLEMMGSQGRRDRTYLETLLRYAVTAPTPTERRWAAEKYLDLGGDNPSISRAFMDSDAERAAEVFLMLQGFSRRDVYRSMLEAVDGSPAQELRQGAMEYSGYSLTDRNEDGFWEERVFVTDGAVSEWELDRNQDGVDEISVTFNDHGAISATVQQGGSSVRITYGSYPYVQIVDVPGEPGISRYSLEPWVFQVRLPEKVASGNLTLESDIGVPEGFPGIDLEAVRLAATSVSDLNADGETVEVREYERGAIVRLARDHNVDGQMDELVVFRDELPAASLRDIDFDGYFEVATSYQDGRETVTVIDEDDNGVPETVERASDSGIREWDLDQDGRIDVVEFGIWTDRIETQFPLLDRGQ